jgi:hypothetical protein
VATIIAAQAAINFRTFMSLFLFGFSIVGCKWFIRSSSHFAIPVMFSILFRSMFGRPYFYFIVLLAVDALSSLSASTF